MNLRAAILLPLLAACATGPTVQPTQEAAPKYEAERNVAGTLRAISVRVKRGDGAKVREELLEQARNRPGDVKLKLYVVWTGAPSEESWQEIHKLTKLNPEDPWLWTASGLIYLQWRGFLDQADTELQHALRAKPGFVPALVGRADVLRLRGKLPEAKAAYEAILADAAEWPEALVGLGLTLFELKDPGARAMLERALKADPDSQATVAAMAKLAGETEDPDAAIGLYQKMIGFNPKDREAHLALAKAYDKKGETARAAEEFELAMAIGPDAATAHALADAYKKLSKSEEEIRALEKVSQMEPSNSAAYLRIAEVRKAEKDNEGAEQALRAASERKPGDPAILLALARQIRERDDLIAAIDAFRQAKAAGAEEAPAELKEVEAKAFVSEKPVTGNVQKVYEQVFFQLRKQYDERRKTSSNLAGRLKVKVSISAEGKASQVDILEDTVHDEVLAALVYFGLKDAGYAKEKRSPTFEFVLSSGK